MAPMIWTVVSWVLIIAGLAGIILPVLPGVLLIFAGMLVYGYAGDFEVISTGFLLWMLLLTLASYALDSMAGLIGARRSGATRAGTIGAFLGGIAGLFLFPPYGLLLGPALGALLGELLAGNQKEQAARASLGTIMGMLAGTVLKLTIGVSMIFLFIARIRS